jgi:hypothetical protein
MVITASLPPPNVGLPLEGGSVILLADSPSPTSKVSRDEDARPHLRSPPNAQQSCAAFPRAAHTPEPVNESGDAMKASLNPTLRRFLFLSTACLVIGALPPNAFAKTRPPIEAGDPDVGNSKPSDGPGASASLFTPPAVDLNSRVVSLTRPHQANIAGWFRLYLQVIWPAFWP